MPAPSLVIVADDLTGALDTAAPFASAGLVTRVVPWSGRGAHQALQAAGRCDVAAIDTDSRGVRPSVAAARVAAATRAAREVGATQLYKKIDSAWRGPLLEELQAFRRAAGVDRLPLVPAFPAQGRTVRGGEPYVAGAPVFERAPTAVGPAGGAAEVVDRIRAASGDLELFDATTDADLRRIAQRLGRAGRLGATAGSGGFAHVLAAMGHRGTPAHRRPVPLVERRVGAVLIVAGSAHPATRRQLHYAARRGMRGVVVPASGPSSTRAWRETRDATVALACAWLSEAEAVFLTLPDVASAIAGRAAARAARRLAETAQEVLARVRPQALVVAGGDTLGALGRARGITRFDVHGVIAPGMALASWRRAGQRVAPHWIVTKSGGFGREDALVRLCGYLGGQ